MRKVVRTLKWLTLLVGAAGIVYFAGSIYLGIDEVLDCKIKQWHAGGKKAPEIDLASNITFRTEGDNIVADFRKLDATWSRMCLTSYYEPGSPYLGMREGPGAVVGGNRRTIGCWRGSDPSHLTVSLVNRRTGEGEDYQVPIPGDLRDPKHKPILVTNYSIPELSNGLYQCSPMSSAVASCKRDAYAVPGYCLLVFHR